MAYLNNSLVNSAWSITTSFTNALLNSGSNITKEWWPWGKNALYMKWLPSKGSPFVRPIYTSGFITLGSVSWLLKNLL